MTGTSVTRQEEKPLADRLDSPALLDSQKYIPYWLRGVPLVFTVLELAAGIAISLLLSPTIGTLLATIATLQLFFCFLGIDELQYNKEALISDQLLNLGRGSIVGACITPFLLGIFTIHFDAMLLIPVAVALVGGVALVVIADSLKPVDDMGYPPSESLLSKLSSQDNLDIESRDTPAYRSRLSRWWRPDSERPNEEQNHDLPGSDTQLDA